MKTDFNFKKTYYVGVITAIAAMITGLFWGNPYFDILNSTFILHAFLLAIFSFCLLLYPLFKNRMMKAVILITATAYFYAIFFLYPGTWSTFIYICLIPAISIFFFDSLLFYCTLILNSFFMTSILSYIMFSKQSDLYHLTNQDLIGNVINFLGSQIILFFLYYATYLRVKRQQDYYEQIQQSERIKTAGQLAAAVAHEIRNPLTVVKGFLQLYEQDSSYSREAKEHYALMIDELDTAEQVISQFLAVSAPNKKIYAEKVNVKESLHSVVSLLNSYSLLHDNRIDLKAGEEGSIAANEIEFKQLCINLIKNAIEASEEKHPVLIQTKQVRNGMEIKIIDRGKGMSEAEIQSLGTPFYSLKSKGTGLGLMICFNIVKKYKGTIRFESMVGKGTTAIVQFPLYRELLSEEGDPVLVQQKNTSR